MFAKRSTLWSYKKNFERKVHDFILFFSFFPQLRNTLSGSSAFWLFHTHVRIHSINSFSKFTILHVDPINYFFKFTILFADQFNEISFLEIYNFSPMFLSFSPNRQRQEVLERQTPPLAYSWQHGDIYYLKPIQW